MNTTIGFIGGGNMATSLIGGLIKNGSIAADNVFLFEPSGDKAAELQSHYQLKLADNNQQLVTQSDIVVIAVKPQILQSVLQPLAPVFKERQPLIISVVAGITAKSIEQWLEGRFSVVRVMPNTPALVGKGASGLYGNSLVTAEQKRFTEQLISSVGLTAWVNQESDIDSVTALSGSGPAYFMLFIKCLVEAAQAAGLSEETSKLLAVQTAAGAAELVAQSDVPLQTLIDNVTSPNGTTEAALKSFDKNDLSTLVHQAFSAAKIRSEQLAIELG